MRISLEHVASLPWEIREKVRIKKKKKGLEKRMKEDVGGNLACPFILWVSCRIIKIHSEPWRHPGFIFMYSTGF